MVGSDAEVIHAIVICIYIHVEPITRQRFFVRSNRQVDECEYDVAYVRLCIAPLELRHAKYLLLRNVVLQIEEEPVGTPQRSALTAGVVDCRVQDKEMARVAAAGF